MFCHIGTEGSRTILPICLLSMFERAPNASGMLKNRITEIRNERGLSIEELAAKADLSPSYISRMARGERNISLKNLDKLASALDCHPEDLMGGENPVAADIADIWAAIPPERRELAKQVLESFVGSNRISGVDPNVKSGVESGFRKTKK